MVNAKRGGTLIGGEEYCRRVEVAERLRVSVRTAERWARDGDGPPFVMLGRIPIYPIKELDNWMRARLVTSTATAPDMGPSGDDEAPSPADA